MLMDTDMEMARHLSDHCCRPTMQAHDALPQTSPSPTDGSRGLEGADRRQCSHIKIDRKKILHDSARVAVARYSALLFAMMCVLVPPSLLMAQDTAGIKEELLLLKEETVSIAARHEQPISEAPSNVYVITDEDIRHSGATDLPTVLRRIPGMEVIQMTGAQFDVSIRGDNQPRANKLLVLLDGRTIYLDLQGEVYWKAIPVTLPEIKRIEVLKGPGGSALYGFNAFDGVVNIITKSPEEMKGDTNGTMLQFGGGEFGTITASAIQAGTLGKFGYRLSAGHDQNSEWRDRNALAFRDQKFNVHTEYALSNVSRVSVSGGLLDVNRYDGQVVENVFTQNKITQGYARVAYERPNFFIRSWWTGVDLPAEIRAHPDLARFLVVTDRNGSTTQTQEWDTYDVEAQHALEFGDRNRFTYGANYRHSTIASNFLDQSTGEVRFGLYFQDEWRMTDALTAVGGMRFDLHTEINPTYSPRLALVYQITSNHSLRASGSVAYRPPTIYETHNDSRGKVFFLGCPPVCALFAPTVLQGNKNLDPEQIISYDAGYQGWYFKHRLRARADLFFNHLSDLIIFQRLPGTPPTANPVFFNSGKGDIYGGEVGVEFLATRWLTGFANYAQQDFGQRFIGTGVRAGPKYKANAGLRGEWENGLNGEAALHFVGPAVYPLNSLFFSTFPGLVQLDPRVGSYFLLNLRGAYRFWHERAEVAVTAFNALNDQHKEHPLGDTISSRVMGWLTLRY